MAHPVRVSAVSFLNARPLVHGLEKRRDLFEVSVDLPARCAERLHTGDVDLGLVPAIESLRGDYRLVPDMAIGSDGAVLSVAVFTTRPIGEVRTLALDASSRTSVALTRILCARLWKIAPEQQAMVPDLPRMLEQADAALVIGDPAFDADPVALGVEKIDLGQAWRELTGLPFVYAAWTGRPGALSPAHLTALAEVRDAGLAARPAIAADYAAATGRPAAAVESYLRDNLSYAFGPREQAGLERFFALAIEVGLVPPGPAPRFY